MSTSTAGIIMNLCADVDGAHDALLIFDLVPPAG